MNIAYTGGTWGCARGGALTGEWGGALTEGGTLTVPPLRSMLPELRNIRSFYPT